MPQTATAPWTVPSYNIDSQTWVTARLAAHEGVWPDPYFDAGGGEIWMITRSLPVRDATGIIAIVNTDLTVDPPARLQLYSVNSPISAHSTV